MPTAVPVPLGSSSDVNTGQHNALGIARSQVNDTQATHLSSEKPTESVTAQLMSRAAKKRLRKKKGAMRPAAPAMTVTRGFETPSTSAGEESDQSCASTPPRLYSLKRDSSATRSPALGTSSLTRAISGLRLQEDSTSEPTSRGRSPLVPSLGFDSQVGQSSPLVKILSEDEVSNVSNDFGAETYEVPLESDFASVEDKPKRLFGVAVEGGLRTDSPHRKMTASDFTPLKCLGKGTYGTVLLVKQHSTGRLFAQKQRRLP